MNRPSTGSPRGRERAAVVAVIALHLCATIPLAILLNIWIDEAYSLMTTSKGFGYAFTRSREFELQPPFYFLQLRAWRTLNDSVLFARFNSIVIAVAAIWVVYLAARRWIKDASPLWVVVPLAVNVPFLEAATEVRTYALLALLSGLLFLFFYDGFYREKPSRTAQVLYTATAAISLFTYYFTGFLLVGLAATLILDKRWRTLGVYLLCMGFVGALNIGNILYSFGHVESATGGVADLPSMLRSVEYVGLRVFSIPLGVTTLPRAVRWGSVIVLAAVVTALLWKGRKQLPKETRAIWVVTVIVAGAYTFVVRFVAAEELALRHLSVMFIPGLFAIVSTLPLSGSRRTLMLTVWVGGVLGFNAVAGVQQFGILARSGDYARASTFIEENEHPGESIVMLHSHAALPFGYYYRGTSRMLPTPNSSFEVYHPAEWRLESVDQIRKILRDAESSDGLVWVFTDFAPDFEKFGVDFNMEVLVEVIESDYLSLKSRDFFGSKVWLLQRRRAPNAGVLGGEASGAADPPGGPGPGGPPSPG
jgi:hypothetical protein